MHLYYIELNLIVQKKNKKSTALLDLKFIIETKIKYIFIKIKF